MATFEERLKQAARAIGFDLVGITGVTPASYDRFQDWLARGFAGEMAYLERHAEARQHLDSILPGVASVVMTGVAYSPPKAAVSREDRLTGRIASYAQGRDYHPVLWDLLDKLLAWVRDERPGVRGRGVVDTAPLLERDFARLAGLGWFGKNTMLLNTELGSYFFLGALLLDTPLRPDPVFETPHCGTCTACLDACPTQAFPIAGTLDARRCISYLTIELREPIPRELRPYMGDWLFGCDVCQEVCPWNRKAPEARVPDLKPQGELQLPELIDLLELTPEAFRQRFRRTPITRTKRAGLLRNAAIALGNKRDDRAVPALKRALGDEEPLVRGAAAWALGRLGTEDALAALEDRLDREQDPSVRDEIALGLEQAGHDHASETLRRLDQTG